MCSDGFEEMDYDYVVFSDSDMDSDADDMTGYLVKRLKEAEIRRLRRKRRTQQLQRQQKREEKRKTIQDKPSERAAKAKLLLEEFVKHKEAERRIKAEEEKKVNFNLTDQARRKFRQAGF